jgi:uncharacterized protein YbbC (DUF1343 family)
MKYSKFTYLDSMLKYTIIALAFVSNSCNAKSTSSLEIASSQDAVALVQLQEKPQQIAPIQTAADQIDLWVLGFKGKNIAVVGNQTSVVRSSPMYNKDGSINTNVTYTHLVDTLISRGVNVKKVFAPEHGFRGTADAGESIKDGIDKKTGIPIISLYGANKKPTAEQLEGIDFVFFDIQDVGARFYTYISTLHYVMEACSRADIMVVVLDRPNPNGNIVDGPVLEKEHSSFVGMHPIPVLHGMTIAEYAQMINGERWLEYNLKCDLLVLRNKNYTRDMPYSLPFKPSPNLPNDKSINLYASLCFFEGTDVSVGRGTDMQFQVYGAPQLKAYKDFSFTPRPNEGASNPPHNGKLCHGVDLRDYEMLTYLDLQFLIDAYNKTENKKIFFNSFFTKLAGSKKLQQQIEQGMTAAQIRMTWTKDIAAFQAMRAPYLIYK